VPFKLSKDPLFIGGRDVVGLYLNPPDGGAVVCIVALFTRICTNPCRRAG
jgi:hypothetical protein